MARAGQASPTRASPLSSLLTIRFIAVNLNLASENTSPAFWLRGNQPE
jgi:hypothetical protein